MATSKNILESVSRWINTRDGTCVSFRPWSNRPISIGPGDDCLLSATCVSVNVHLTSRNEKSQGRNRFSNTPTATFARVRGTYLHAPTPPRKPTGPSFMLRTIIILRDEQLTTWPPFAVSTHAADSDLSTQFMIQLAPTCAHWERARYPILRGAHRLSESRILSRPPSSRGQNSFYSIPQSPQSRRTS